MLSAFQNFGHLGAPAGAPWTERALYPSGASSPGLWIDGPSYPAACYQDSAGTTALSTVGTVLDSSNPVGLVLDRKGGLSVSGSDTVTNGNFATDTAWTKGTGVTITGGAAVFTNVAANQDSLYQSCMTAGKYYEFTYTVLDFSAGSIRMDNGAYSGPLRSANGTYTERVRTASPNIVFKAGAAGTTLKLTDISIREIPGIHLSQSTSAARPVASARKNFLWADLTGNTAGSGKWTKQTGVTIDSLGSGVYRINFNADGQGVYASITSCNAGGVAVSGVKYIASIDVCTESGSGTVTLREPIGAQFADKDISVTTTWTRFNSGSVTATATDMGLWIAKKAGSVSSVLVRFPQLEFGSTVTEYQNVVSSSSYTATGPAYLKFDGTDDGLSSATFSAGTLTSSMDCLIAVRRDSAANVIIGLADGVTSYFGVIVPGGSGAAASCPIWVDGVQLPGGSSVTHDTLHLAVTVGAWHIVEFRGLNLSAWASAGFSTYSGFRLNGALGKILLFASGQDSNRDKARARMAAYFGVTLP